MGARRPIAPAARSTAAAFTLWTCSTSGRRSRHRAPGAVDRSSARGASLQRGVRRVAHPLTERVGAEPARARHRDRVAERRAGAAARSSTIVSAPPVPISAMTTSRFIACTRRAVRRHSGRSCRSPGPLASPLAERAPRLVVGDGGHARHGRDESRGSSGATRIPSIPCRTTSGIPPTRLRRPAGRTTSPEGARAAGPPRRRARRRSRLRRSSVDGSADETAEFDTVGRCQACRERLEIGPLRSVPDDDQPQARHVRDRTKQASTRLTGASSPSQSTVGSTRRSRRR